MLNDQGGIDLWRIIGAIRRRIGLIASAIVAIMLLVTLVLLSITPQFTASALVLVDPATKNLLNPQEQSGYSGTEIARMESEVEILRSDAIGVRVLELNGLLDNAEFNDPTPGWKSALLKALRLRTPKPATPNDELQRTLRQLHNRVEIERIGATFLINIRAQSSNPELSAKLANSLAETYIDAQVEAKIQSMLDARDVLEKRIKLASAAVAESERALDDFILENLDKIAQETGSGDIEQLRQRLLGANKQRTQGLEQLASIELKLGQQAWDEVATSLQSAELRQLALRRQTFAEELAKTAAGTPKAVDLQSELAGINQQLETRGRQGLTDLRRSVAAAGNEEAELQKQVRSAILDANLPADILTGLYALQRGSEIRRSQFETLLARLRDVEAQSDLQIADSRIVSAALPPSDPSSPKIKLSLALALALAAMAGVSLALAYENYVGGFVDIDQTEGVLGVDGVVPVPRQKVARSPGAMVPDGLANMIIDAPLSSYAESVRRIRVSVDQAVNQSDIGTLDEGRRGTVILVSSTVSEEGKTTLALSLARAYAMAGQRTLLIDCDLRKPSIADQTNLVATYNLIDLLADPSRLEDPVAEAVVAEAESGLHLILGARRHHVPTSDLITGPAFGHVIRNATNRYDVVVLDSPPVEAVVDGLRLAPLADQLVFVARWGSTPQQWAKRALHSLQTANVNAGVTVVLNQVERATHAYTSAYASYRDYYEESPLSAQIQRHTQDARN